MATSQRPGLFSLPLELRLKIYEELLCPRPEKPLQLYHDREGRRTPMNLHPSILAVNKQFYDEAIALLYERNIFEISLTTPVVQQCTIRQYPDSLDPPDLLRRDATSGSSSESGLKPSLFPLLAKRRKQMQPPRPGFTDPGVIHPKCLRRMRHIRLLTSRGAIWAQSMAGYFPAPTGEAILEILSLLPCEGTPHIPKVLDFRVLPDWQTKHGIFALGDTDARDHKALEIARELRNVKRTRTVNLEEKARSASTGKLEAIQIDVERFISKRTRIQYDIMRN